MFSARSFNRLAKATGYSWQGLRAAFRNEEAFRQELLLFAALAPLAFWLGDSGVERALLLGTLFLVLIVELLNSAIETAIDRFGEESHPLSGRAKDMGSAAVIVSIACVIVVWGVLLFS